MGVLGLARISLKKILRGGNARLAIIKNKCREQKIYRKEESLGREIIGKEGNTKNRWKSKWIKEIKKFGKREVFLSQNKIENLIKIKWAFEN